MADLDDYSGELKPYLKLQDFSKEALIRLANVLVKDLLGHDGSWFDEIANRYGLKVAEDCSNAIWAGDDLRGNTADMRRLRQAFGIEGSDVAAAMKYCQLSPMAVPCYLYATECELKSRNHGILTVHYCPFLKHFEKHGQPERAHLACVVNDIPWFQKVAQCFNPKMTVTPLLDLPRKSNDRVPCQWQFKLE